MRKLSIQSSALVIASVILLSIVAPHRVAADGVENYASSSNSCPSISDFDWSSWLHESNSIYDYNNTSYVVTMDSLNYAAYTSNSRPGNSDPGYSWTIYVNSQIGSKLTISGDEYVSQTSGVHTGYHGLIRAGEVYNASTGVTAQGSIDVYTVDDYNYKPNPISTTTPIQRVGTGAHPATFTVVDTHSYPYQYGYPLTGIGGRNTTYTGSPTTGCIVAAHNVTYANWSFAKPNAALAYTEGKAAAGSGSQACSTFNIGCYLANAFQALSTEMANIMSAFWDSVVHMFVPNSVDIATIWSNFYNQLQTTMGFMFYPLTFLTNLFSAMTDTSNQWCTSSSCQVDAGSFFGGNFTINLRALQTAIPGAWTLLTNLARGALVFGLIFMIRRKALGWLGNQKEG